MSKPTSKPPINPVDLMNSEPDTAPEGAESVAAGYDVPASPVIAEARSTIAAATDRPPVPERAASAVFARLNEQHADPHEVAQQYSQQETAARAMDRPVARNYANDAYVGDMIDGGVGVVDMMANNMDLQFTREQLLEKSTGFREFADQASYEAFMMEPVVIQIHSSRDKNEPPQCFVGVNGNKRWLPREKPVRIPRLLVERLAQAQERSYTTTPNEDPRVDNMMKTLIRNAASYSFSVLHDPNPVGRRWLARITREGT